MSSKNPSIASSGFRSNTKRSGDTTGDRRTQMKKIIRIQGAPKPHWVGDGFPVRSMFSYDADTNALSPFLLLDYAGPAQFAPALSLIHISEPTRLGMIS